MDTGRFDRLSKALARLTSRRSLTRALAGLPLLGASGLLAGTTAARRKRRAHAEKKNKKCNSALTRCTVRRGKKKKAICANTRTDTTHCGGCGVACETGQTCANGLCVGGVCMPETEDVTCANTCGQVVNNCQQTVNCGDCGCTPDPMAVTCAGKCGQVVNNCGTPVECPSWANQSTFGSFGTADDRFQNPWDVAVTDDGLTALIADTSNYRISVWTRTTANSTDWAPQTNFGSNGEVQFQFPVGVVVSTDGLTAWATDADYDNSRISVWERTTASSTDWSPQTTFGSFRTAPHQVYNPAGLAVSADDQSIWVADLGNSRISAWTRICPA